MRNLEALLLVNISSLATPLKNCGSEKGSYQSKSREATSNTCCRPTENHQKRMRSTKENFQSSKDIYIRFVDKGRRKPSPALGKIYKDFYFPDPFEFNKSLLGRTQLIKYDEAKFKI